MFSSEKHSYLLKMLLKKFLTFKKVSTVFKSTRSIHKYHSVFKALLEILLVSNLSTRCDALPLEVEMDNKWNTVSLSTGCLRAYSRSSRIRSIPAVPIAARVFFLHECHWIEFPLNDVTYCACSFTLDRLSASFVVAKILPMSGLVLFKWNFLAESIFLEEEIKQILP